VHCETSTNLDVHHIIRRADGGDHDPANLIVLCAGHHTLHHRGLLSIRGRAPDRLSFARDGKALVDARSPAESRATHQLHEQARLARDEEGDRTSLVAAVGEDRAKKPNKFDDVVRFQTAKRALMDLGYKARAASKALEDASAHVDADADVAVLVKAVLARAGGKDECEADNFSLAKRALVQLGYPAAVATVAIERARAHVDTTDDLQIIIKEALRFCS
jgi:hypothetical protein